MSEVKKFLLHLRLNYNFLILSAPFLLGAIYVPGVINLNSFILSFILVYIFLFGGANAYNSYFDKDDGPIGGLEHPPKMKRWMYYCAWVMQIIAFCLCLVFFEPTFSLIFLFSISLSWLYSSPIFRFKGKPILSFIVVGIGTSFNTTLLGYLSAGGGMPTADILLGALGSTLIILSMYPFSQAYQIEEDTRRKDVTFAVKYGIKGIKTNYLILFPLGILLLALSFKFIPYLPYYILSIGVLIYIIVWQIVKKISGHKNEYRKIMKTKYFCGIAFTFMMAIFLLYI